MNGKPQNIYDDPDSSPDAVLVVERVVEPVPSEQWLDSHPQPRDERRRPVFLLVRARKPAP